MPGMFIIPPPWPPRIIAMLRQQPHMPPASLLRLRRLVGHRVVNSGLPHAARHAALSRRRGLGLLAGTAHLGSGGLHQSKERKRAQRHRVRMGRASGFVAAPMIAGGPSGGCHKPAISKGTATIEWDQYQGANAFDGSYPAVFANPKGITTGGAVDRSHDVRLAPRSGRTRTMRSSGRFALPIFRVFRWRQRRQASRAQQAPARI